MEQPLISIKNDNSVENKELDFRGPVVGFYSIVLGEELYDLNDHYSKPWVKEDKVVVRSPVEAGINIIAFVIISIMTIFAYMKNPVEIDYWTTPFKLVHFFFHTMIHIVPNYSKENGMEHKKCLRIICGILFGLSRYIVIGIYFWRISLYALLGLIVIFGLTTKLRFLGELIKTAIAYITLCYLMCTGECSGLCTVCVVGTFFQLLGSGAFYYVGQVKGHIYKPWLRENDRKYLPFHVLSDLGNAMFLIGIAYDPSKTLAFNEPGMNEFPFCWWS